MPTPKAKSKMSSLDVGVVTESSLNSSPVRGKSTVKDVKQQTNLSDEAVKSLEIALENIRKGETPEYTWCGVKRFAYQLPEELRKKLLLMIDDYQFTAPQLFTVLEPYVKQTSVHLTPWIISKHRLRLKSSGCSCKNVAGEV
jgi:hypothetical protein